MSDYDYDAPFKTPDEIADELVESLHWNYFDMTTMSDMVLADTIAAAIEADRAQVRAYIEAYEHPDDWNVPCIYTKRLREHLNMAPSERKF